LAREGLRGPEIPFLSTAPGFFRVLLFQPQGAIVATEHSVGVLDRPLLNDQMSAFLRQARGLGSDLAACPEYSCPWDALCGAIDAGVVPAEGKLWAIACESISVTDLRARAAALEGRCRVVVDWPAPGANGEFLDCLCYLFVTLTEAHDAALTLLVQFKTCQMGGDTYESEHLILGNALFRFGSANGNRLVGLLCSDSLSQRVRDNIVPQLRHDTLILHLQLNPNGDNPVFRSYREQCSNEAPRNTEVLCLNWAKGTTLVDGDDSTDLIVEPRTILFRSADELDATDECIISNHRLGCYLTYWEPYRSAAYVFSPDPQLFAFKMTKPMVIGGAALARRSGIIMNERFEWNQGDWTRATHDASDRFEDYWFGEFPESRDYLDPSTERSLDVERLIQLSTGRGLQARLDDWKTLPSFNLDTDDTARRLRLCWSTRGQGHAFRAACLRDFRGFVTTLQNRNAFSPRLSAFKNSAFSVAYRREPPFLQHRNLHLDNGSSATAVFVGYAPESTELSRIKASLIKRISDMNGDRELLAIWYMDQHGTVIDHMDGQVPKISDDPSSDPAGIGNTDL
jgi:hypothetical protein